MLELNIVRDKELTLTPTFCLGLCTDIIESEEPQRLAARYRRGHEKTRLRSSQHDMPGTKSNFNILNLQDVDITLS